MLTHVIVIYEWAAGGRRMEEGEGKESPDTSAAASASAVAFTASLKEMHTHKSICM